MEKGRVVESRRPRYCAIWVGLENIATCSVRGGCGGSGGCSSPGWGGRRNHLERMDASVNEPVVGRAVKVTSE
jgi:hypothetical protein